MVYPQFLIRDITPTIQLASICPPLPFEPLCLRIESKACLR